MKTYQEIKSVEYIEPMLNFAERMLGLEFRSVGKLRYSAFCPFHADTKDSFRVYVDGNDVVRFKCFGACQGGSDDEKANWDIYDLIMLRKKMSFSASATDMV